MTKVWVIMENDFPDGKVFEDEDEANAYVKAKMDDPANWHPNSNVPYIYWRSYEAKLLRKMIGGNPGPLQRMVLGAMADGGVRSPDQISAKIAVDYKNRFAVASIIAAISGMIHMKGRYWLEEQPPGDDHKRRYKITDRGQQLAQR